MPKLQILKSETPPDKPFSSFTDAFIKARQFEKELSYKKSLLSYEIKKLEIAAKTAATEEEKHKLEQDKSKLKKWEYVIGAKDQFKDANGNFDMDGWKKFAGTIGMDDEDFQDPDTLKTLSKMQPTPDTRKTESEIGENIAQKGEAEAGARYKSMSSHALSNMPGMEDYPGMAQQGQPAQGPPMQGPPPNAPAMNAIDMKGKMADLAMSPEMQAGPQMPQQGQIPQQAPPDVGGGAPPEQPVNASRANATDRIVPSGYSFGPGGASMSYANLDSLEQESFSKGMGAKRAEIESQLKPVRSQWTEYKKVFKAAVKEMGGLSRKQLQAYAEGGVAALESQIGEMPNVFVANKLVEAMGLQLASFLNRGRPADKDQIAAISVLMRLHYSEGANEILMEYVDNMLKGEDDAYVNGQRFFSHLKHGKMPPPIKGAIQSEIDEIDAALANVGGL